MLRRKLVFCDLLTVSSVARRNASQVGLRGNFPRRRFLRNSRESEALSALFKMYVSLPSELTRLPRQDARRIEFLINLDHEVFTLFDAVHFELNNILRQNNLWLHAICSRIYWPHAIIDFNICPEDHVVFLALDLRMISYLCDFNHSQNKYTTQAAISCVEMLPFWGQIY